MVKKLIFLIMVMLISRMAHAVPYFADEIVDYDSGTGLDFTGDAHTPRALGPSDIVFLSIGEAGHMTFAFDELFLTDGAGSDVRVYTTSHSISNEHAEVSASLDGINFLSLGILDQNRPSTFVGNGPDYSIYYEEFDLGAAGINKARYIKVTDLAGGFVATDLDALAILNSAPVPESSTIIYWGIGILFLFLVGRKEIPQYEIIGSRG